MNSVNSLKKKEKKFMKNEWVALITDQHFGVRNNSQVFLDYYFKFYEETFFPTLKKYGIEEVIDLGDTFDKRKTVDFNVKVDFI